MVVSGGGAVVVTGAGSVPQANSAVVMTRANRIKDVFFIRYTSQNENTIPTAAAMAM